jgi:[protein-PII] uridylyltransferase
MNQPATLAAEAKAQRIALLQRLQAEPTGIEFCKGLTATYDSLWRRLWTAALSQFDSLPPLSIVAVGGYGRSEVAPHSDVDLAFIPAEETPELEAAMKWMFRTAHDVFSREIGVPLSATYRLFADLPGLDAINLTALIDGRLVAGSSAPFQELTSALWSTFPTAEFLFTKLQERNAECRGTHDVPQVTQPHLKSGAGGLRDFHALNWIGLAIGERPRPVNAHVDTLLRIRNQLHLIAERRLDLLNFNRRDELAQLIGTSPWELGAEVCEAMTQIREDYLDGLRRLRENRFSLGAHATAIRGEVRLTSNSPAGEAVATLAQAFRIGLDLPASVPPLNPRVGQEVLQVVNAGSKTLRSLLDRGFLEIILPDLHACRYLMPRDASHTYSVAEHTLVALSQLEQIESGHPFASIKESCNDLTPLNLALLFHDLGKVATDRSHSDVGAEMVARSGEKWSLEPHLVSDATWLVQEHLTMSQFLRMRDIDLPETIAEFAVTVRSAERLRLLTLLTYCDITAVSPEIWSPLQETQLLNLYERTANLLERDSSPDDWEELAVNRAVKSAQQSHLSETEIEDFLAQMPAHYVLSTPDETIHTHIGLIHQVTENNVIVDFQDDRAHGVTEVTVAMPDRAGILLEILGVLYAHNLSMNQLRCTTSTAEPPLIVDTFTVSRANQPIPVNQKNRIRQDLIAVLTGQTSLDDLMIKRGKEPQRKQQVLALEIIERDPLIIEVRAPKGKGLAYRLARVISAQGLTILSARLGQWAGSASAGFYVAHPQKLPINPTKLREAFTESRYPNDSL